MKKTYVSTVILVSPTNRVLLQLRDNIPIIYAPGMWGNFGGSVEERETSEEAAYRECKEELGIELDNIEKFKKINLENKKNDALPHTEVWGL